MSARGRQVLEAGLANEYEAELLQINPGAPFIVLDNVGYLEDGTPIEHFHAILRGDRSCFEVDLVRVPERRSTKKSLSEEAWAVLSDDFHHEAEE